MKKFEFISKEIAGRTYRYRVSRGVDEHYPKKTVYIILPVHNSMEMTDVAIRCIKKYTAEPYIIWVVDNKSDKEMQGYLSTLSGVNIIYNLSGIGTWYHPSWLMKYSGSTANAVSLELAAEVIRNEPIQSRLMFVMHNDAAPVQEGWLEFLKSKLNYKTRIVGTSQDKSRAGAMHQSGFLFDFGLYDKLDLHFMHDMPIYDVGDFITIGLRAAGYDEYVCKNTYNNPATVNLITQGDYPDFVKNNILDRCFNDDGELIYMHLGRGTTRNKDAMKDGYLKKSEWISGLREHYL